MYRIVHAEDNIPKVLLNEYRPIQYIKTVIEDEKIELRITNGN